MVRDDLISSLFAFLSTKSNLFFYQTFIFLLLKTKEMNILEQPRSFLEYVSQKYKESGIKRFIKPA